MPATSDYSVGALLPYARLALKETSNGELYHFMDGLFAQLEKANIRGVQKRPQSHGGPHRYDYSMNCPNDLKDGAGQVFLHLMHRGIIAPEFFNFPSSISFGRWRITARGTEWASGADPVPEDAAGYLVGLRKAVPTIDDIIFQYVQEGVTALARDTYFAAAVMLGAACEKEIYLLAQSLLGALASSGDQKKLKELLDSRRLFHLLNQIEKHLGGCTKDRNMFDGAQRHLLSMFESIRVQRNDAVHPNSASVSEDSVRQAYAAFPLALKKAEQIRDWLDKNPVSI